MKKSRLVILSPCDKQLITDLIAEINVVHILFITGTIIIIGVSIKNIRGHQLLQLRDAGGYIRFSPGLVQRRQQHGGQNGDDRQHDEQFNKSENSFHTVFPSLADVNFELTESEESEYYGLFPVLAAFASPSGTRSVQNSRIMIFPFSLSSAIGE